MTRRKTPGLDNPDGVKYIVRSLFPHVEPFQRQDQSSCVDHSKELFTLEKLKKAAGKLKANSAGDRRVAERHPQRGDRGIPGDPPRSLQILSSGGEVLRRLEEAEVGSTKEGQETSRGCLIV